jgi:hypothetical protein
MYCQGEGRLLGFLSHKQVGREDLCGGVCLRGAGVDGWSDRGLRQSFLVYRRRTRGLKPTAVLDRCVWVGHCAKTHAAGGWTSRARPPASAFRPSSPGTPWWACPSPRPRPSGTGPSGCPVAPEPTHERASRTVCCCQSPSSRAARAQRSKVSVASSTGPSRVFPLLSGPSSVTWRCTDTAAPARRLVWFSPMPAPATSP